MRQFCELMLGNTTAPRILDVSGAEAFWKGSGIDPDAVTILNVHRTTERHRFIQGDGCALPSADGSFDVFFFEQRNRTRRHLGSVRWLLHPRCAALGEHTGYRHRRVSSSL